MTITKKVGSLLLLLTVGSLVGILTFTIFLQRTSVDFLFFLAATNEERLLQQLYVNTDLIQDGHVDIRAHQQELILDFDALLSALENGGPNTLRLTPIELTERVEAAGGQLAGTMESGGPEVVRLLTDGLPMPPAELRGETAALRGQWRQVRDLFLVQAEDPAADSLFIDRSEIMQRMPAISQASRNVLATAGARLIDKRRMMLVTLGSIAGLSIVLFAAGLIFTRRFIARPIQNLQSASQRIGAGDFSYRVPDALHESSDELAVLGKTFNTMADHVQLSLDRYRELFENATDFVYNADPKGRFLTVNRAAETISGYSREELLQKTFADLMPPAEAEAFRQKQEVLLSADSLKTFNEVDILSKDGKRVSLEDSRRPIFENGIVSGIQGVARDVTERNRLKEKLDLAHKMEAIGRLAGGIAHDFGNVLTIITGYCTLIQKSLKADDPLQEEVAGIQRASHRAASMIRQLLGFSRGQILSPKVLAVDKAISDVINVLGRLIPKNVSLVTKFAPRLGRINMDPTQFEQILVNLVLNARDAMPQGGKIRIEAANEDLFAVEATDKDGLAPGPYIRLSVTDTGCGMPPDVVSRIFEPFFSTKTKGTGLGLSSVYSIVRQSGGQISAESEQGKGTTMTIHLPRVLDVATQDETVKPSNSDRRDETILLVEDEADVRRFVREMLRSEGYSVVEAMDQSDAIALCSRAGEHIDLVLTDVVMPDMSGPELADRLRSLRPELKILFMSGYARDRFDEHKKRGEIVHFIQKPLSSKALAEKVRGILDGEA